MAIWNGTILSVFQPLTSRHYRLEGPPRLPKCEHASEGSLPVGDAGDPIRPSALRLPWQLSLRVIGGADPGSYQGRFISVRGVRDRIIRVCD